MVAAGAGVADGVTTTAVGRRWARLEREPGPAGGARSLARLLRSADEHGEERVRDILEQALEQERFIELAVQRPQRQARFPDIERFEQPHALGEAGAGRRGRGRRGISCCGRR